MSLVLHYLSQHSQDTGIANWTVNLQSVSGSKGKQKQVDKTCTWLLSMFWILAENCIFILCNVSFKGGLICMNVSLIFRLIIFKGEMWIFS